MDAKFVLEPQKLFIFKNEVAIMLTGEEIKEVKEIIKDI
jgi:hypothetical protein